ncbi:izumo sperm-egg fusion protein 1-like isoform X1 [Prionailurus iriomotensis]
MLDNLRHFRDIVTIAQRSNLIHRASTALPSYCLLPARSCVMCDERVVAAPDSLDKEYLLTHMAPKRHRQVMKTIRETVRNFKDLPDLKSPFYGGC